MFRANINVPSIITEREFSITLLLIIHQHYSWVQVECLIEHQISLLLKLKITSIPYDLHVKCYMRSCVQEVNTLPNPKMKARNIFRKHMVQVYKEPEDE